jgi:hypothetical protein
MGAFETNDRESDRLLKPLRVPSRRQAIHQAAKEMVEDLPEWKLVSEDESAGTLTCRREARFLGAPSTITISIQGPDDVPTTTVHVRSVTEGGLLARDRKNVQEFMKLFFRRVSDVHGAR